MSSLYAQSLYEYDRLICQIFSIFKWFIFQPNYNKELKKKVSPEHIIINILEEGRGQVCISTNDISKRNLISCFKYSKIDPGILG